MKNKDILIGLGFVALVIAGFVLLGSFGSQGETAPATGGVLAAEQPTYDFGAVSMTAGKVSYDFKIKNTSAEPVLVSKVYTSCMCTNATLNADGRRLGPFGMPGHGPMPSANVTLAPGQEATVTAVFDPAAHGPAGVGKVDRTVRVETGSGQQLDLRFTARVTP